MIIVKCQGVGFEFKWAKPFNHHQQNGTDEIHDINLNRFSFLNELQ